MTVDRKPDRAPADIRGVASAPHPVTGSANQISSASLSSKSDQNYPDPSNANRRSPFIKQGVHEIPIRYDARMMDVCGELVCTTGHLTRVWNILDGELMTSFSHGEGIKATSIIFKPGTDVHDEGTRLWIGNSNGELMEVDIATQSVVCSKPNVHGRYEVTKIYRHYNELWTLDESGTLLVWGPDSSGTPSLAHSAHQTFRVPKGHTFSMVVGDELWHATGKEIRVFAPTSDGQTQFQVLIRPLMQDSAGEVTSGTTTRAHQGKVFFGHVDGKVSIYSTSDYTCLGLLNVTSFKINTLTGVGKYLWAGFNAGRVCVYDIEQTPWVVKKDWQAHDNPVVKLLHDPASSYRLDRIQVLSLGVDNMVKVWDGLLQEDWLESQMKIRDTQYCQFDQLKVMVMTWNAGASTPHSLRYSDSDATFIRDLVQNSNSPDILVFGFQELVDLEDKTATASKYMPANLEPGRFNINNCANRTFLKVEEEGRN
jgi:WD40 repeat protein